MDVYSFGMLIWEFFYEKVPFDGDLEQTIEFVLNQDARPLIKVEDEEESSEESEEEKYQSHRSTRINQIPDGIAKIIRMCWQTNPTIRPSFELVCEMLIK